MENVTDIVRMWKQSVLSHFSWPSCKDMQEVEYRDNQLEILIFFECIDCHGIHYYKKQSCRLVFFEASYSV